MSRAILSALLVAVFLSSASVLAAQNHAAEKNESQALGMHFGNVSGNGYAYRLFTKTVGFQFVLGGYTSGNNEYSFPDQIVAYEQNPPLTITDTDNGRKYNFNLGGNLIFPLKRTDNIFFYLHAGLCWLYSSQKRYSQTYGLDSVYANVYSYYSPRGGVTSSDKVKSYVNVGAGPGVELMLGKYFKLALELPVTFTGKQEFIMYVPQAGIYYYFR